jgi:hypothetical protein
MMLACSSAPMDDAKDGDGGMEAATCSSAVTSPTLDEDIGAGCRRVTLRLFTSADDAQDDDVRTVCSPASPLLPLRTTLA